MITRKAHVSPWHLTCPSMHWSRQTLSTSTSYSIYSVFLHPWCDKLFSSTWCLSFFRSLLFLISFSEVVNAWILSCYSNLLKGKGGKAGPRRVSRSQTISNDLKHLFPLFLRNGHGKGWLNLKHIGEGLQVSLLPSFKYRSRTNALPLVSVALQAQLVSRALWAETCTWISRLW